ncbi:MAG: hypothetical protein J6W84_07615 [Bacteroidales bacterium]|nr:hypothetical protein [Bacteroidales bacterium]
MKENSEQDFFIIPKFKEDELFKVPEGFFDTLPEKALAAVKADEAKRGLARRKWFYYISSAAAAAIVVVLMVLYIPKNDDGALVADNKTVTVVKDTEAEKEVQPADEANDIEEVNEKTEDSLPAVQPVVSKPRTVASAPVAATPVEMAAKEAVAEVSEPDAAAQDDTPIYACSTGFDEMCYIDYQFLEYYSDEIEDSEYGDIR